MANHERPEIAFLDDDGNPLGSDAIDDGAALDEAVHRRARLEQWLPDGGGAALAALVFVLIAWLGCAPLITAVTVLAPQGLHRVGQLSEQSIQYGTTDYPGVTPGLVPVISFGVRGLVALVALVLAFRARGRERSTVAAAALTTASISLVLFALGGVATAIGLALGHGAGFGITQPF